jgi:hypothetical protein
MITASSRLFAATCAAAAVLSAAPVMAQPAPAAPTTGVLTMLTIRPDADRSTIPGIMPNEVRDTVRLYLDGKIAQWWARSDGRGVVFILSVASVADAKALMETLPLAKANIATFEYIPLTPLTPLRILLADPAAPKGSRER